MPATMEQIQKIINILKQHEEILDVAVSDVPTNIELPDTVTDPIRIDITVQNVSKNLTGVVSLIVPDIVYNNISENSDRSLLIRHLIFSLEYNLNHHDDVVIPDKVLFLVNPNTEKFIVPVASFNPIPADINTVDVELQKLVNLAKELPDIKEIRLHEYINPQVKESLETEKAYKCFFYFEHPLSPYNNTSVFSVRIKKETYMKEESHVGVVDNIQNLIQQRRSEQF
jgi:hypothetical protein